MAQTYYLRFVSSPTRRIYYQGTAYEFDTSTNAVIIPKNPDNSNSTRGCDFWVIPADGYTFVRAENNTTDFISVYAWGSSAQTVYTSIYADGTSSPTGFSLTWDSTFSYGGVTGAYKVTISVDSLYFNQGTYDGTSGRIAVFNIDNIEMEQRATVEHSVTYDLSNCTVSPQPETMAGGIEYELTFTPTMGYEFTTQPSASTGETATDGVLTLTPSTDNGDAITITASATEKEAFSVTYNLTNCTVSPQPTTIHDGDSYTLTFTPNDGYSFETQPNATWKALGGATDGATATDGVMTLTPVALESAVTITASAVSSGSATTTHAVTYDLSNCTVSPQPETMAGGTTYTLTFTPNDGYSFEAQPSASTGETATDGVLTLTPSTDNGDAITITASAMSSGSTTTTYAVTYNLSNCTVSPQPASVEVGTAYTLTFTPSTGYEFETQPRVQWYDAIGLSHSATATDGVLTFTIAEGDEPSGSVSIRASAIASGTITEAYGIVRVYEVTADNLANIAQYGVSSGQEVDLTQYIATLRKFFAPVNGSGSVNLELGSYDVGDDVPQITDDVMTFDCGSVAVSGYHSNALDYNNTNVEFWLPFVGRIEAATERVMDSTVNLTYKVNTLNGDCNAILSVDGIPVAEGSGNMSYEIPYNSQDNYSVSSALTMSPLYLLDLTPSVVVRESRMLTTERVHDSEWVKVGDQTGFCAFDGFSVSGIQASYTELGMIASYLENGVIV